MPSIRKWKKEFKKEPVVVFNCTSCKRDGAGRDLRYKTVKEVPEKCSMECPVCQQHVLFLDREATLKQYKVLVP